MSAQVMAQLRSALEQAFAPTTLEILDDSAAHAGHEGSRAGGHYRVTVVAEAFRGRSRLERHRLVYAAVRAHGDSPGVRATMLSACTAPWKSGATAA